MGSEILTIPDAYVEDFAHFLIDSEETMKAYLPDGDVKQIMSWAGEMLEALSGVDEDEEDEEE